VHIHTAEDLADQHDSLAKYNQRVIQRLDRHGLLGENSIVVHGVHLDAAEIDLLKRTNTALAHQPRSNMNNAVGIGDVQSMLNHGVLVCLGNDGFSNAMWEEWKTAYLVHKAWQRDPQRMGGYDLMRIAVENNRQLVSKHFGIKTGQIAAGYQADLMFVDYQPYTPFTGGNFPWHAVFGFRDSMVTATMVRGKFLMKDRKILGIDAQGILKEALALAPHIWAAYQKSF
jgi:cytosine/adenosine deaminase-related metal-dependent hydrolase